MKKTIKTSFTRAHCDTYQTHLEPGDQFEISIDETKSTKKQIEIFKSIDEVVSTSKGFEYYDKKGDEVDQYEFPDSFEIDF